MKRSQFVLGIALSLAMLPIAALGQLSISTPVTENLPYPESVDNLHPRFSWKTISDHANMLQAAYEIVVMDGKKAVWKSGKKMSRQQLFILYAGSELASGRLYNWKVRVWDTAGRVSPWSADAYFRMALLSAADWKAKWIAVGFKEDSMRASPVFRKQFQAKRRIVSALVYVTAHGLYEATINGQRVGNAYLAPGYTDYKKRLQYQVYDVTNQLQAGSNELQVMLASGWYRGNYGFNILKEIYGKELALYYQLELTYSNGDKETIVSDDSWQCTTGTVTYSELYHGETIDHRRVPANWVPVKVVDFPCDDLIASCSEPVIKQEVFKPLSIKKTSAGETVIDFGQNLAGVVHVRVSGKAGDTIVLDHGEILDKKGNFYNDNLRSAKARDVFVLDGQGEEEFEPRFTYHGFRYVRVKGFVPTMENVEAVALYSGMPQTGTFECSNVLVNRLQHNINWSQNGNFVDIPTDCPQRDERLGWTGDAQAFCQTAAFNRKVDNFFAKWLKDLAADQFADGGVPYVIPNVLDSARGSAGWSDAATIIPWTMYQVYGDKKILEDQYASMKAWVRFMQDNAKEDLWNNSAQFGDWLSYRSEGLDDRSANTDRSFIAQCYYAYSTQIVINTARVLGKEADVATYTALLERIKAAFMEEYVTPKGRLMSNTQTAYVLSLRYDMLPEKLRPVAAKYLADNIASYGNHLTTGFLGTYNLAPTLTKFGYTDLAYSLLLQESYPSWLYPVTKDATTIWERWDGMRTDSSFQTTDMNSFNHYSYGAIGEWMYRTVLGIDMDSSVVAYQKIKIRPYPGGKLTYAKGSLETGYGQIGVSWRIMDACILMDVAVPANCTAEVYVPEVGGKWRKEVVGSGTYHFEGDFKY